jgi:predicted nucleic acid-binding protein
MSVRRQIKSWGDFQLTSAQVEREAIALALEAGADLVILDDQRGRRIAREKGLSVTGTVGVLIEARGQDMISSHLSMEPEISTKNTKNEIFETYHALLLGGFK